MSDWSEFERMLEYPGLWFSRADVSGTRLISWDFISVSKIVPDDWTDGWSLDILRRPMASNKHGFLFSKVEVYALRAVDMISLPEMVSPVWLAPLLSGIVLPQKKIVEIEADELRTIGLANYEYQFKPLLAYAMQYPPFAGGRQVKMARSAGRREK